MHHLLERQYKKILKDGKDISSSFEDFLKIISNTYTNNDIDRTLLERSFTINARELSDLNSKILKLYKELEIEKNSIEEKIIERTKELVVANKRLLELDKVKSEFISIAAHQLRTPLSAIKWILSSLIEQDTSNLRIEQKSLLTKSYESSERIIKLVNELLVVTKIDSGKMAYSFSLIHVEDLISACLEDFLSEVKIRNLYLNFQAPESKLPPINGDPNRIRDVIENLIENAIFYSRDHGSITVSVKSEEGNIKVSVKDNGIGIPQKQQLGIFNKFFRASNAMTVRTNGSGLGLFVAKNIIEEHHGTIGFESNEGEDTIFYFTIPYAQIIQ